MQQHAVRAMAPQRAGALRVRTIVTSLSTSESTRHDSDAYNGVIGAMGVFFGAVHAKSPQNMQRLWHVVHKSAHLRQLDETGAVENVPAVDASLFLEKSTDLSARPVSENQTTEPSVDWGGVCTDGEAELVTPADETARIVNVDILHPEKAALATVMYTLHQKAHTDFLSLLKLNDKWMIVNNVSTSTDHHHIPAYIETADPVNSSHVCIASTLAKYFSAGHHCDPELMEEVLHPTCSVMTVKENGTLHERDLHTFLRDMVANSKPASNDPAVTKFDKIISIVKSGPDSAMAKVQIGFPQVDRVFTYHLGLLKEKNKWMIVSKTYVDEPWSSI